MQQCLRECVCYPAVPGRCVPPRKAEGPVAVAAARAAHALKQVMRAWPLNSCTHWPPIHQASHARVTHLHPCVCPLARHQDCYSFGVLLWELVARRQPWSKQNMMQVAVAVAVNNDRLPLLPLVEAGAPPKLQRLVTQCFDADPQRRPAAAELVKELLLVQQQLASGSTA